MDIKIKERKIRFLEKLSFILFGIFITSFIFAILIKYLETWGIWLGLAVTSLLVFCGFYYAEKATRMRLITWGILGTVVFVGSFLIIMLGFFAKSFENL